MAKRFTDTDKWDKRWYRTLSPKMKLMWTYICDSCDPAGIWSEDLDLASYKIGEKIDVVEYDATFGDKIIRLEEFKVFIPAFIEFQYGELSETCKPHLSAIKILRKHGIDPQNLTLSKEYAKSLETLKDKEKNKNKEKDKEKEKGEETKIVSNPIAPSEIQTLKNTWLETRSALGMPGAVMSMAEEIELGRALQKHGFAAANQALIGARFQEKTATYDPAKWLTLGTIFGKDKNGYERITGFIGLASKKNKILEIERARELRAIDEMDDFDPNSPAAVEGRRQMAALMKNFGKMPDGAA